jgi:transaldolase/transaldolase/glucose-6-phosphate isomerase
VTKLQQLHESGQSIWYDFIQRDMLTGSGLEELVDSGIRGVTSNPSIFEKAIADSNLYDEQIASLGDLGAPEIFETLAIDDITAAADILKGVFDASDGHDGYVSLEVSPELAHDTSGTIADAMRLWDKVDRPNLMVKVPATAAGIPAIEELTAAGLNINATLMFSLSDYEAVAMAYIQGAERASDPSKLASVASFFVSRVDAATDAALERIDTDHALELRGQAAIANAKIAYSRYQELFEGDRFNALRSGGARPQRVLWASTSTKNPDYNDVMYVEELIGPNTVNTAPPATIDAFVDHGVVKAGSLLAGMDDAATFINSLPEVGVKFDFITEKLQIDGVDAFADAYASLLGAIELKQAQITRTPMRPSSAPSSSSRRRSRHDPRGFAPSDERCRRYEPRKPVAC